MDLTGEIENDVLIGRDGELFLASGGHKVLEYATGQLTVDDAVVEIFRRNIEARAEYAKRVGTPYLHVIFPDKQSVIPERFVIADPVRLGAHFLDLLTDLQATVLYPLELLRSCERPPFWRTDTHLSHDGTIAVATQIAETLMAEDLSPELGKLREKLTLRLIRQGDLGRKLEPPREAEELFANIDWRRNYFHNDVPGGNNGAVDIYFSPDARFKKRLLWFGDSFGKGAINFLSYFFSEILFLRTPFFHHEFVEQMRPDLIVSDNVERYLASCSPDENRPLFHMFPFLTGKGYHAKPLFAQAFSAILSYPRQPYHDFLGKLQGATSGEKPAETESSSTKVATGIPISDAAEEDGVRTLFEGVMRRPPNTQELQHWRGVFRLDDDFFRLFMAMQNHPAYQARSRVKVAWPPGHFYSPIVDPATVGDYVARESQAAPADIPGITLDVDAMALFWTSHQDFIAATPFRKEPCADLRYYWRDSPFPIGDAVTYRAIINALRPRRIIEVGSGFSSACALDALDEIGSDAVMTCIDPFLDVLRQRLRPTDASRVTIVEAAVQDLPRERFAELEHGDILFIDSTHVLKTGSDVHYTFFSILPQLKPGVAVHFHGVRWPFEYPRHFIFDRNFSWNEAYGLRALLMFSTRFSVLFYNNLFAALHGSLARRTFADFMTSSGSSIWLRVNDH